MGFLGFPEIEIRTVVVLTLSTTTLVLVNQIEQPFARSLVDCDTPLNTTAGAPFTGSLYCGNREYVIGRGTVISGNGQALEQFGKIITTFVISYVADSIGRKAAALYGMTCALVSVVLFIIASQVRFAAPVLFVIAQGLQGCNGIDVVSRTVSGDIMLQSEDSVGCAKRGQMVGLLMMFVCFTLSMVVLSQNFTDFTGIWAAMVAANVLAVLSIIFVMPETNAAVKGKDTAEKRSLATIVTSEVKGYHSLMVENPYVGWTAVELFFGGTSDAVNSIIGPFMMARFGMGQFEAAIALIPALVLALIFMPFVPALAKRYGHRKAYTWSLICHFSITVLSTPLMGISVLGVPMPIFNMLLLTPFAGIGPISDAFRNRLVGTDNMAKFAVLETVIKMVVGSFTSVFYSRLFVAEATTTLQLLAPFIMATVFRVLSYSVFFFCHGHIVLAECDKIYAEEQAAAKAAEEAAKEATKAAAEKKGD